ncbi:MAG: TSUP family transporter, partial [Nitrososphaeria archaeon]|nr:TSUP family transporter [Nitrososphaeria archaeon]
LGFVAAFCDATAGGGWGPIATPSLIMTNKSEPRKVIGSVDASEFFIALAQTLTFLIVLRPETFHWRWVLALIIGGAAAAPLAAYTCKRVPSRWLGFLVGGILIVTNLLTLFNVLGVVS